MYEVSQYGGNGSLDDNQCINTGLSSINIIGFTDPGNMNALDGAMYDTQIARIQHTKAMSLVLLKSAKMTTKQAITLIILDHGSTRRVGNLFYVLPLRYVVILDWEYYTW
ncbi:predicted protein [Lichtheimia corymbifera JMRC:FSU:9682]|uniref:Uncharacterized protein n=1 Tax=Lichtheimia corymbifera JMRC:FSU:9682 TaxID=1263082 RepID=A0A068SE19_9FUNG|nr:predicted protein [Lichtheimia corymbifera JMRC:FSU:9682]